MKCSKATRMLQLYMDRQLTLEQIRVLEAHVYACPACREELFLLEEVGRSLRTMKLVAEPADLTINIMQRVALSPRGSEQHVREPRPFVLFRPSISEILAAFALATVAMLGIALEQPVVRAAVLQGGHNSIALFFAMLWTSLGATNSETLMFSLWIIGTLLGVWITLAVAGSDMRTVWFRAVVNRLPVW